MTWHLCSTNLHSQLSGWADRWNRGSSDKGQPWGYPGQEPCWRRREEQRHRVFPTNASAWVRAVPIFITSHLFSLRRNKIKCSNIPFPDEREIRWNLCNVSAPAISLALVSMMLPARRVCSAVLNCVVLFVLFFYESFLSCLVVLF